MPTENNSSLASIAGAIAIGLSLIVTAFILREPLDKGFDLRQEGPVFIRFDKSSGELCYTGLAPNGHFATESWLCMAGDKTKAGETLKLPSADQLDKLKSKNSKSSQTTTTTTKKEDKE